MKTGHKPKVRKPRGRLMGAPEVVRGPCALTEDELIAKIEALADRLLALQPLKGSKA